MTLTTQDLDQIRNVMLEAIEVAVNPRLDDIEATQEKQTSILQEHSVILNEHSAILQEHSVILNEHSRNLGEHSQILREHTNKLDSLTESVDDIKGHLQALEADVKELYRIVTRTKSGRKSTSGETDFDAEQRMLALYKDFQTLAKRLNIKLPAA